jgi:hypothetical protein
MSSAKFPAVCVGGLNRTASILFRCIFWKSLTAFLKTRVQIAMMWAVTDNKVS